MPERSIHRRMILWHIIRKYVAVVLLVFGIIVGLITVLLPFSELYQRPLERFLSAQWGRSVQLDELEGRWRGTGPEFKVGNLSIRGAHSVSIEQATLRLNVYKFLWPGGSNGLELVINNATLKLAQESIGSDSKPGTQQLASPRIVEQLMASGSLLIENLAFEAEPFLQDNLGVLLQHPVRTSLQVQQDKNRRAIQLDLSGEQLVDRAQILAITDKRRQVLKDARWYMKLDGLRLGAFQSLNRRLKVPASQLDGTLWFTTRHGRMVEALALARLRPDPALTKNDPHATPVLSGHMRLEFSGEPNGKHWQAWVRIQDLATHQLAQDEMNLHISRSGSQLQVKADVLDVAMLHNLLAMFGLPGLPENDWRFSGVLRQVSIIHDMDRRRLVSVRLRFEGLAGSMPRMVVDNLSGEIRLDGDELRILVDSEQGQLDLPGLIRRPVAWNRLVLSLAADVQSESPQLRIPQLWCDCQDMQIDAMARLLQEEALTLNVAAQLSAVKVRQLYKYWPAGIWKEKIINWLDNSLQGGMVENAGIVYLGNVRRYPFPDHSGRFLAIADTRDLVLQYAPDWPKVRALDAEVSFLNRGMSATVFSARTLDAAITGGQVRIADFKQAVLETRVSASGRDNYLLDFLRAGPLGLKIQLLKEDIRLRGPSDVHVSLHLPLKPGRKEIRPQATMHLREVDFSLNEFVLDAVRGNLVLETDRLQLRQLQARFLDHVMTLSGQVLLRPLQVDLHMQGMISAGNLTDALKRPIPAWGQAHWRFELKNLFAGDKQASVQTKQTTPPLTLIAESDLQGLAVQLPLPLAKTSQSATPLRFSCTPPCVSEHIDLRYGDIMRATIRIVPEAGQVIIESLRFGVKEFDDMVAELPVSGEIDVLDLDGWLSLLAHRDTEKSLFILPDGEYRVHIKRGIFMSRIIHDVDVSVRRADSAWHIGLSGPQVSGEVVVADDADSRGIVVRLDKLDWPEMMTPDSNDLRAESFDLPALHVWVKDFTYQGIPLGQMRLEMRPVVGGMKIEKFESRNQWVSLNATGEWQRNSTEEPAMKSRATGQSRFHIIMLSDNLGRFLRSIGYDSPVKGGQTVIEMNAHWPGPPSAFSFDRLSGDMTVRIGPGEVTEAKPGIGRVFGLLNLANLPRRLILDFADVLSQGLRFEAMSGHFSLRDGLAVTDDFEVLYSGARIRVEGKVDLVRQTYDQILTVIPKVGQILPTLGAIAGGPAGAAAGFFMQGVLNDPLKKTGKFIYHVTGSWHTPEIRLINTDKAEPHDIPMDYRQPRSDADDLVPAGQADRGAASQRTEEEVGERGAGNTGDVKQKADT